MMTEMLCRYSGDREHAIVSSLYGDEGDADVAGRAAFERHFPTCERCRSELAAFEDVRLSLGRWAPPELNSRQSTVGSRLPIVDRRQSTVLPAWAQAVAAVLLLGVAAGIANLDIQYDAGGFRVRTGWLAAPAAVADDRSADQGPWRAELTALEQRLRADLGPAPAAATPVGAGTAATMGPEALRRIRTIVEESERRQQRELALRLGEAMREVSVQRQEDLVRIDRNIGAMQNTTGREMLRQRSDLLNYVTVRTAGRPQ